MSTNEVLVGLDEVGMGCLAGPLVVAAIAFNGTSSYEGLKDSKKLSKKKREELQEPLLNDCISYGIGWVPAHEVDTIGLSESWQMAARIALEDLEEFADIKYNDVGIQKYRLVVDGCRKPNVDWWSGPIVVEPKADERYWQVAAASIIAKVQRDKHMEAISKDFPGYRWEKNSGYGTKEHIKAIKEKGATVHHRMSFLRKIT